jgi:molecular chaperone DnaK (HSP70)
MATKEAQAIGIDLGTTSCRVAHCGPAGPDAIANDVGDRQTPTVVCYTASEALLGHPAVLGAARNLEGTVRGFAGLLGVRPGHKAAELAAARCSPQPVPPQGEARLSARGFTCLDGTP